MGGGTTGMRMSVPSIAPGFPQMVFAHHLMIKHRFKVIVSCAGVRYVSLLGKSMPTLYDKAHLMLLDNVSP